MSATTSPCFKQFYPSWPFHYPQEGTDDEDNPWCATMVVLFGG